MVDIASLGTRFLGFISRSIPERTSLETEAVIVACSYSAMHIYFKCIGTQAGADIGLSSRDGTSYPIDRRTNNMLLP